ncbi:MAG: hypothetical protein A2V70_01740 [Planctomycetes bacterium RBG_13_63_9]|nr:MAG: hypothetical protein A2V70_01740 [Planctomycetes bacterium RBG_13_63_9]
MGVLQPGRASAIEPTRSARTACAAMLGTIASAAALAAGILLGSAPALSAAPSSTMVSSSNVSSSRTRQASYHATTSLAARRSALRSIPIDKLDATARAQVQSVLSNVGVFRRMPIRVVDCDPDLYLFLVRHPDVIVNIWEVLNISTLSLRQIAPNTYRIAEPNGTLADVRFLYRSHDTHILYGEGSYDGPLFAQPVKGRCLMVLKTGYVREPDGRYYITSRLDTFVSVDHEGAELLTKAIGPLMGKTADINFVQTIAFLGSLSRTAEVNSAGVQRLAERLTHVQPEARRRLAELATDVARKYATASSRTTTVPTRVVSRTRVDAKGP